MGFHLSPITVGIIKKTTNANKDMEKRDLVGGNVN
jgi:hypothetical protein